MVRVPAERLVDAVLQLAVVDRLLWLAAGDIGALEPAEPRPVAPRWAGQKTARRGVDGVRGPSECVRIKHVDAGDSVRVGRRVLGQLNRSHRVEVVKQL